MVDGVSGLFGAFSLKVEASGNETQPGGIPAIILVVTIVMELYEHLHLIQFNSITVAGL